MAVCGGAAGASILLSSEVIVRGPLFLGSVFGIPDDDAPVVKSKDSPPSEAAEASAVVAGTSMAAAVVSDVCPPAAFSGCGVTLLGKAESFLPSFSSFSS